jgi:hypothetical protein
MAFDFPAAPTEGQVFAPVGGPTYVFHAPVWNRQSEANASIVTIHRWTATALQTVFEGALATPPITVTPLDENIEALLGNLPLMSGIDYTRAGLDFTLTGTPAIAGEVFQTRIIRGP